MGAKDEIDTIPILKDAISKGKRVGVPKCISRGIMEVCEMKSLEDLKVGRYGILEPQNKSVLIPPNELELALIPCLSCSGWVGWDGGGFYDRYLLMTDAVRAVLCRGILMVYSNFRISFL